MIRIRLAHNTDLPAMQQIAARTWDGEDYLPRVLADWLADPDSYFYVAINEAEAVVGMARLARFANDEWWLEGIRVEPALYGQGIGRLLHNHCVEQAQQLGSGHLRFATSSTNKAIQKLAAETGFQRSGAYSFYRADTHTRHANQFRLLTAADISIVQEFLSSSPYFSKAARSMEQSYRWQLVTESRLHDRSDAHQLYGWYSKGDALSGVVILNPAVPPEPGKIAMLDLAYLDAAIGKLAVMCDAVRGLAGSLEFRKVQHWFLALPERLVAIEQAGFHRRGTEQGYLFGRDIHEKDKLT